MDDSSNSVEKVISHRILACFTPSRTNFSLVLQQGVISEDVFGFMASIDPYGEGEVIFGGYNANMTTHGITWHDVITFEPVPGHVIDWLWALPASGLYVRSLFLRYIIPLVLLISTSNLYSLRDNSNFK